ncbi:hypothetical protein [Streptomyces sp. NPDC055709]
MILPAFLTCQAVAQMAATVRNAAVATGRDPTAPRVYATVITAADPAPEDHRILAGRAVSYLQPAPHGERIARLNGWDAAPLAKLRAHPMLADETYHPHELAGLPHRGNHCLVVVGYFRLRQHLQSERKPLGALVLPGVVETTDDGSLG